MHVLFNDPPPMGSANAALASSAGMGLWWVLFSTWFRRKPPVNPQVLGAMLRRVDDLRRSKFPSRYVQLRAARIRAKLLAEAREGLDRKSFFENRQPDGYLTRL